MYSVPFHVTHCKVSMLLFFSKPSLRQPLRVHSSSVASHLAPCSGILQRGRNVLADLQTSQVRSVLGGELMSIVSSIVVNLTVGPYRLATTDAYRSHSDAPQQGGRHRRGGGGGSMSSSGVRRLLAGKPRNNGSEVILLRMPCQAESLRKSHQSLERSSSQITPPPPPCSSSP